MKIREAMRIMGPAFLVSVAYLDPGNFATAIEAGSRFGYELVWVVVLSNLIAILLQTLAARLGLVTGKHLAQVCREAYPPLVIYLLWVLCEISIVALDVTMVLGTAIGLNMLFGLPLLPCIIATSLDVLLLVLLVPQRGVRTSEQLTVGLLAVVVLCFVVDLFVSQPPVLAVVGGMVPTLRRESVYAAVCLLGANVMPHSFYLHSALVSGQARGMAGNSLNELLHYNTIDIACALGVALVVNVAVLLVSAATFHPAGIVVETLQAAHDLMEQTLSSSIAPAAFGMALLCAGQLSTFTGTIAGQVVLRGFLNIRISTWARRLATRTAAILPAAVLQWLYGDKGTYKFLLVAQVVLALQLPFTLVPLIKATSSAAIMGRYKNSTLMAAAAWAASLLVFFANAALFVSQLLPGATLVPLVQPGGPDSAAHQYFDNLALMAWQRPGQFLTVITLLVGCSSLLALQLWMFAVPLRQAGARPLLGQQLGQEEQDMGFDDARWEARPLLKQHDESGGSRQRQEDVQVSMSSAVDMSAFSRGRPLLRPLTTIELAMAEKALLQLAEQQQEQQQQQHGNQRQQLQWHQQHHQQQQPLHQWRHMPAGQQQQPPALLALPPSLPAAPLPAAPSNQELQQQMPLSQQHSFAISSEASIADASIPDSWEDATADHFVLPVHHSVPLHTQEQYSYTVQEEWEDAATSIISDSLSECTTVSASQQLPSTIPSGASTPRTAGTIGGISDSSGMPRAARRQLAAVLDEHWGRYYDPHGHCLAGGGKLASPLQCVHSQGALCCRHCGQQLRMDAADTVQLLLQLQGAREALLADSSHASPMHTGADGGADGLGSWAGIVHLYPATARHWQEVQRLANHEMQHTICAPVPAAAFVSFGLWCLITLLQHCQAERRPELWGKYAFTLNRLQGLITDAQLQGPGAPAAAFSWWPWPPEERQQLRMLLLDLLQALEVTVKEKQGPSGNVAYPKGKEIMMSVVKRLRRRLLGSAQQQQHHQQQQSQRPPRGGNRAGAALFSLLVSLLSSGLLLACIVGSLHTDQVHLAR